jgi:allantoin racemase
MDDQMAAANLQEVAHLARFGVDCDNVVLGSGPDSIENAFDEAFCAPFVVLKAMEAERDGVEAVVIDCMGDPGLMAAREAVSFPVVGCGEACMHLAGMMGHRFSCVSILDSVRPIFTAHAKVYGVADKLASVRCINVPVLELEKLGHEVLVEKLYEQSLLAVRMDLADTIILGCTGFVGVAEALHRRLVDSGYPVPVINPLPTAVFLAAMLVNGGLTHSRQAYRKPNLGKTFKGFDIPKS